MESYSSNAGTYKKPQGNILLVAPHGQDRSFSCSFTSGSATQRRSTQDNTAFLQTATAASLVARSAWRLHKLNTRLNLHVWFGCLRSSLSVGTWRTDFYGQYQFLPCGYCVLAITFPDAAGRWL